MLKLSKFKKKWQTLDFPRQVEVQDPQSPISASIQLQFHTIPENGVAMNPSRVIFLTKREE